MKHLLVLFFALLTACLASAQNTRYLQAVFDSVKITKNIVYGLADPFDFFVVQNNLDSMHLDIYEPYDDSLASRPLVVAIFGGAFLGGSKDIADMPAWGDSLARSGYVCATIQYRLLFNPLAEGSVVRAAYRAVQDARAAVRFLKEYHALYHIDTTQIYMLGNSAGAITTLYTAFLRDDSERPVETFGFGTGSDSDDLGCLDCSGNSFNHTVELAGIVPLWGGVWDMNIIEQKEGLPTLLIHGTEDSTVPYNTGYAFNLPQFSPFTYGSVPIHHRLDSLGIKNQFDSFPGLGHSFILETVGTDVVLLMQYWVPVLNIVRTFLYQVHTGTFTSIHEPPRETNLLIYPNPASRQVIVQLPEQGNLPATISIISLEGKTLQRVNSNGNDKTIIDLHNFSSRNLFGEDGIACRNHPC